MRSILETSTELKIIVIADNLSGGGAILARNIIHSILESSTRVSVMVLGSPKLRLSEGILQKLTIYKETKCRFPGILISRISFVRSQRKVDIILNLTNFPIGSKFLRDGNEICLLHNAYLFSKIRQKRRYDVSFLLQRFLKILTFRILLSFSDNDITSFLVQTEWMRTCVRNKVPLKFQLMKAKRHTWPMPRQSFTLDQGLVEITKRINHMIGDKISWFYPASAEPHKNHLELIQLFAEAVKIDKNLILLLTLPTKSKFTKIILKKINELSMEQHICNLGWLEEDVKNYMMYRCDGIVFFSNFESLGLPLIEIHKLKKPSIVLKSAISLEILGPGTHLYDLFSYDQEVQANEKKRLISSILAPAESDVTTDTENQASIADAYLKLNDII